MAYPTLSPTTLQSVEGASAYPLVTKANSALPNGPCRGLLVGTAGTANLKDIYGNIETDVPLSVGINPLKCSEVRTGGTADNIRALY